MDSDSAMGLYILISVLTSLIANILFYRLVYKKHKRMKANTFSWLSNLGVMLIINIALIFPFTTNIDVGSIGAGIGYPLVMMFIIAPVFWFVPSSFYTMVRAIYIAITRKKEREILSEEIVDTELDTTAYDVIENNR